MGFIMKTALILVFFSPTDFLDGQGEDVEDKIITYNNETGLNFKTDYCKDFIGSKQIQICDNSGRICHSKYITCGEG